MTVSELIAALSKVDGDRKVFISYPQEGENGWEIGYAAACGMSVVKDVIVIN